MKRLWSFAVFTFSIVLLMMSLSVTNARRQPPASPHWAMMYDTDRAVASQFGAEVYMFHPQTGSVRPLMTFNSQYDAASILSGFIYTVTPDHQWLWFPDNVDRMTRRFDTIDRYHWTGLRGDSFTIPPLDVDIVFWTLRWSLSGEWAIFLYPSENNTLMLYRIDAINGELTAIHTEYPYIQSPSVIWMDENMAIIRDPNSAVDFSLYKVDFDNWTLQRIIRLDSYTQLPVLSPSATRFVYTVFDFDGIGEVIVVIDEAGNVIRELELGGSLNSMIWLDDDTLVGFVFYYSDLRVAALRLRISSGLHLFTSIPEITAVDDVYWSPDKTHYAVVPDADRRDLLPNFTIAIHSNHHTLRASVTPQSICQPAQQPYWSADSQWLLYWERDGNVCRIYRIQADGSNMSQLYAIPDDSRLAFFRPASNNDWMELVVYDTRGNRAPSHLFDISSGREIPLPESGVIESWISPDIPAGDMNIVAIVGGIVFGSITLWQFRKL